MATSIILETLARLETALKAEIEILQEGRFQELRTVQQETANALQSLDGLRAQMSQPGIDQSAIERAMAAIRFQAARAQGLLGSALHGARDARSRLDGLNSANDQVGVYTASGAQVSMKNFASPYNKTI